MNMNSDDCFFFSCLMEATLLGDGEDLVGDCATSATATPSPSLSVAESLSHTFSVTAITKFISHYNASHEISDCLCIIIK